MKLSLSPATRLPSLSSTLRRRRAKASKESNNAAAAKAIFKSHEYLMHQNNQEFDFGAPRPAAPVGKNNKGAVGNNVGNFSYASYVKRDTGPTYCASDDDDEDDDYSSDDDDVSVSVSICSESSALTPRARTIRAQAQDASPPTPPPPLEPKQERGRHNENQDQSEGKARSRSPSPDVDIWITCQKEHFNDSQMTFDDDWSYDPFEAEESPSAESPSLADAHEETMNVQKKYKEIDASSRTEATLPLALDSIVSSRDGTPSGRGGRRDSMKTLSNGVDPLQCYIKEKETKSHLSKIPRSRDHVKLLESHESTASSQESSRGCTRNSTKTTKETSPQEVELTPKESSQDDNNPQSANIEGKAIKVEEDINITAWRRRTYMILRRYDANPLPDPLFDSVN